MFDHLAMAYKDSDYTIMIAIVCGPKHIILLLLVVVLEF